MVDYLSTVLIMAPEPLGNNVQYVGFGQKIGVH